MGIDIIGRGHSYNWSAWEKLFETGLAYGWKPLGTLSPVDFDGDWSGTYFSNDFQVVAAEDAKAWADALSKASAVERDNLEQIEKKPEQQSPLGNGRQEWLDFMDRFAKIASAGELTLG